MWCPCTAVKKRSTCSNFIIILAAGREAVCYYRITKVDPLIESIGWFRHGVIQCFTIEHKYTWTYILIQSYTTKYLQQKVRRTKLTTSPKGRLSSECVLGPFGPSVSIYSPAFAPFYICYCTYTISKKFQQTREYLKRIRAWHIYMKFTYIQY